MSYSCLSLKTLSLRVVIKFELSNQHLKISKILPKTLSREVSNVHVFFGNYITLGGQQSIWENGKLLDYYSFDDKNWFKSNWENSQRQLANSRREEREPFMVKILPEEYDDGGFTVLVSRSASLDYETEHMVQLKDVPIWNGFIQKQEFFSCGKLFIIYWNIDVPCTADWGSEFYLKRDGLIWKKYNRFSNGITSVIEYNLKRVFW